jgi:ATP-dependent DNA helicase PIF1
MGKLTEEDCVYLKTNSINIDKDDKIKPTKIMCYNKDVDDINDKKLMSLPDSKLHCFEMDIEKDPDWPFSISPAKHCNAKETLKLTKGAQVMLLYNKDIHNGLVNGSRGVITDFNDGLPVVTFVNGMVSTIDYHEWEVKDGGRVVGSIFQIPLRLAYAITVHKSQGLTLDRSYINLRGVFEYGQAYVALSRVKRIDGLTIKGFSIHSFKAHPKAVEYYTSLSS